MSQERMEGTGGGARGEGKPSLLVVSSSSSFFKEPQAEIKGDIFTATEIENHWLHSGR
jgi:hypothetical protein